MVTATAAATSTMQIVEYQVKYYTTTHQTHLKQTTVVVGGKITPRINKKRVTIEVTNNTKAYSAGSVRPKS
jgi:hypothetical protein